MQIRTGALWVLGFALAILCSWCNEAHAQTAPGTARLDWSLPAKNTDGSAIATSGSLALSKVEVWLSGSSIPDTASSTAPTATITPVGVTTTQTVSVPIGGTFFARIRVCNGAGQCSALTNEVSGTAQAPTPGVPTNVTLTIKFT